MSQVEFHYIRSESAWETEQKTFCHHATEEIPVRNRCRITRRRTGVVYAV